MAYLRGTGRQKFSVDDQMVLERLHEEQDKYLVTTFDLFLSDKDEADFLDTLRHIVAKHRDRVAKLRADSLEEREKSEVSERSGVSQKSDGRDNDFEILSVCTITQGENMSEVNTNTVGENTFKAYSAKTPAFHRDPKIDSFHQSQGDERLEFTPENKKQQPTQFHSALHDDKRQSIGITDSITEVRAKDESSPQNASSQVDLNVVSSFGQASTLVQSLAVPPVKDNPRPFAFSFYHKPPAATNPTPAPAPVINIQVEPPKENNAPAEPPKEDRPMTNGNDFSGFGFNDDAEKNSATPSGNFFGGNSKKKTEESRRNSASDNNGFNMLNKNLSDNFVGDTSVPPTFGGSNTLNVTHTTSEPVHSSQHLDLEVNPKPAPTQAVPFEVKNVAHLANMSFNPAGFKALKNMFPPTIVEQKDESEALGSPSKKDHSLTISQTEPLVSPTKDSSLHSPPRFPIEPITTAEGSPLRRKPTTARGRQNKAYLAQILRYVLQHDGADTNLAKLCADLVASSESGSQGASSFPNDLLQFAKKKFTKRLSDYLPPIILEAILERGQVFLPELVACNASGDLDALAAKLVWLSEENADIALYGDKLKQTISTAMIDQAKKNQSLTKETPIMKLKKIGTSMELADPESSHSVSEFSAKRSTMTKASRISGREERRRAENELTEKIYASMTANPKCRRALVELIEVAKRDGEHIEGFQRRTLEEMLEMVN